jgi:hypothetical protein
MSQEWRKKLNWRREHSGFCLADYANKFVSKYSAHHTVGLIEKEYTDHFITAER